MWKIDKYSSIWNLEVSCFTNTWKKGIYFPFSICTGRILQITLLNQRFHWFIVFHIAKQESFVSLCHSVLTNVLFRFLVSFVNLVLRHSVLTNVLSRFWVSFVNLALRHSVLTNVLSHFWVSSVTLFLLLLLNLFLCTLCYTPTPCIDTGGGYIGITPSVCSVVSLFICSSVILSMSPIVSARHLLNRSTI